MLLYNDFKLIKLNKSRIFKKYLTFHNLKLRGTLHQKKNYSSTIILNIASIFVENKNRKVFYKCNIFLLGIN